MKSLYESILSKTKIGIRSKFKSLIADPKVNVKEIDKIWKSLGLGIDAGAGEGYWDGFTSKSAAYYIETPKSHHIYSDILAYIGDAYNADIFIFNEDYAPVKEWAEKIAKTLDMNISFTSDKDIQLNF